MMCFFQSASTICVGGVFHLLPVRSPQVDSLGCRAVHTELILVWDWIMAHCFVNSCSFGLIIRNVGKQCFIILARTLVGRYPVNGSQARRRGCIWDQLNIKVLSWIHMSTGFRSIWRLQTEPGLPSCLGFSALDGMDIESYPFAREVSCRNAAYSYSG